MIKDNIIYEDEDYIVYNKPAGMLVQSDRSFQVDLVSEIMNYLALKGEKGMVSVINRLDRPVSGLVLIAKNKSASAKASKELISGNIDKGYLAVVCGKPDNISGVMVDYLLKDGKNNLTRVGSQNTGDSKRAELEYETIATKEVTDKDEKKVLSLVRIHLITGRHHQIRVQFANRNMPLLGDTKYNTEYHNAKGWFNVALCSCGLRFMGKTFTIKPQGKEFEYFKDELETLYIG